MLARLGRHRFNLLNITHLSAHDVHFVGGAELYLNHIEMAALHDFWDNHSEKVYCQEIKEVTEQQPPVDGGDDAIDAGS